MIKYKNLYYLTNFDCILFQRRLNYEKSFSLISSFHDQFYCKIKDILKHNIFSCNIFGKMKQLCFVTWMMISMILLVSTKEVSSSKELSLSSKLDQRSSKQLKKSKTSKKQRKKQSEKKEETKKQNSDNIFAPILLTFSSLISLILIQRKQTIQFRRLKLAETICEDDDNPDKAQNDQQQQLIYVTGQTKAEELFCHPVTQIGETNLLKIQQQVQVLEWRKKTTNSKKNKQVYYVRRWVTSHVAKSGDKQNNPEHWFMDSETFYNQAVRLGQYELDWSVLDQCKKPKQLMTPNDEHIKMLQQHYQIQRKGFIDQSTIYFFPFSKEQQQQNELYRQKDDLDLIKVTQGALRINFYMYKAGPISVIAKKQCFQQGKVLSTFNIAQLQGEQVQSYNANNSIFDRIKYYCQPEQEILIVIQDHLTRAELFSSKFYQKLRHYALIEGISFVVIFFGFWSIFDQYNMMTQSFSAINLYRGDTKYSELFLALQMSVACYLSAFIITKLIYNAANNVVSIIVGLMILLMLFFNTSGDINDF